MADQFCPHPDCGEPLYTVTDDEGTHRQCNNRHRFVYDDAKETVPAGIRDAAKDLGWISEMSAERTEDLGDKPIALLGELLSQEESQIDGLVPITNPSVNLDALIDGDQDLPRQVVLEVKAGTSRNSRVWSRESLQAIVTKINARGLPGYKGHPDPKKIDFEYQDPATHWIAAREIETGRFLFRGVVDKDEKRLKRNLRTGRTEQISIYGKARGYRRGGLTYVTEFQPHSIDWTPLDRNGMDTKLIAMEMDAVTEPGKYEPGPEDKPDPKKGGRMDLIETIGELRKERVTPDQIVGEMGWKPEDVVKATGLTKLEEVAPLVDKDGFATLQNEAKMFGEMADALGLDEDARKDPAKVKTAAEAVKKSIDDQNTAGRDKIVGEVLKEKVAGDTATDLVKDLLIGEMKDGASKEDVEKLVGEILERPHVKSALRFAKAGGSPAPRDTGSTKETSASNNSNGQDGVPAGARLKHSRI